MIKLKDILNEATTIEQDNEQIIRFLVGNAKELNDIPKTLWNRQKFDKTRDFTKELMKLSKQNGIQLKLGLSDTSKNIMSYNYKKRSDMEKLLRSGNLGRIDAEYVNIPSMGRAIDKFGTSA